MSALKILHFADAHIDIANYGRHDPQTGLPVRVLDFLRSLDEIVDTAIREKVDLVLFAGDAYKDRNPAPTFQREWGRRIIRLSKAKIPTLLLVGNHDISPSIGRAHAMEEYSTLEIPYVRVLSKPELLKPDDLWGLPLQLIALPYVARSQMLASTEVQASDEVKISGEVVERLEQIVEKEFFPQLEKDLPVVLAAHASVQGAIYGGERSVTLGADLILPPGFVKDKRFDYVALGHIHKAQDVNDGQAPPVVYPGSIERVDFGEVRDDKYFVIVNLVKGGTSFEWRKLEHIRPFVDMRVTLDDQEGVMKKLLEALPAKEQMKNAIVRLTIDYPRQLEPFIEESELRAAASETFEFHLVKRPQVEARLRIPEDQRVGDLTAFELLDIYWNNANLNPGDKQALGALAKDIIELNPIEEQ